MSSRPIKLVAAIALTIVTIAFTLAALQKKTTQSVRTAISSVDSDSDSVAVADHEDATGENSTPSLPVLSDFESPIKGEALAWAERIFLNTERYANYERIRLVDVNWSELMGPIKRSQQYLAASSGGSATGNSAALIEMNPFDNMSYQLLIEKVRIHEINGVYITTLSGTISVGDEDGGTWNMSINENTSELIGTFDASDGWTTFGPGPNRSFHVFRSMSQASRQEQRKAKNNW